jgi:hypothetical protein
MNHIRYTGPVNVELRATGNRRSAARVLGRIDFAAAMRIPLREAQAVGNAFSMAIAGTATAVLCTPPDANPKLWKSAKVLGRPTVGLSLMPGTELGTELSRGPAFLLARSRATRDPLAAAVAAAFIGLPTDALGAAVLAAFLNVDACVHATDGCRAACLNRSGHGQFDATIAGRAYRAAFLLAAPLHFVRLLVQELKRWARRFKQERVRGAVRMNVVSDHDWSVVCPELLRWILRRDVFGKGAGYDYTKSADPNRHARHRAIGWDLSLSVACEDQLPRYFALMDAGTVNRLVVVVPVRAKKVRGAYPPIPETFRGRRAVSGDDHDYRPADGTGVVVLLRVKDTFGRSTVDAAVRSGFALVA